MTKFNFVLLSLAFLVVGCRQGSEMSAASSSFESRTFAVGIEPQSKGSLVYSSEDMATMGVYCAHTQDSKWSDQADFDKMEDQLFEYSETLSEWVCDDPVPTWGYVSITDKYTFMAYSPYGDDNYIVPKIENGELVVEYTVPTVCTDQPDLMLALPRKDIYAQVGGTVSLDFRHTLAAIGFNVVGLSTEIITDVTVCGIVESGQVSISDSGEVTWILGDRSDVNYSANIDRKLEPNVYTPQALTLDDGYLMMIPQECSQVELCVTIYDTEEKKSSIKTFSLGDEQFWESGQIYTYTITLSSYDYTIEGTSNCYMLHPNGEDQVFYIPVEGRINTFWRDYADDDKTYENMLSSADEWEATLLWCDFNGNTNNFKVERVTEGFAQEVEVTPFCEPNFTTPQARSAMKISLPSNIDEGNFLVAVTFGGTILWSWHLWVTEYNPDIIAAENHAVSGQYVYSSSGVTGDVHRYDSGDLWATLYDDRFIMDRNLGARDCDYATNRDGVLHYQFGRKDPFPASNSITTNIVDARVSFATAVQNPTSFYTRKSKEYSWAEEGLSMGSSYLWFDKSVANDPAASGKSIFDPSPLGWRVPRYGTFTVLDNDNCQYYNTSKELIYNGVVQFPLTGYRSNNSGNVNDYGSQGNIRLSTQIDSSFGRNFVYDPYVDPDTDNTLADGFCVRCIEE